MRPSPPQFAGAFRSCAWSEPAIREIRTRLLVRSIILERIRSAMDGVSIRFSACLGALSCAVKSSSDTGSPRNPFSLIGELRHAFCNKSHHELREVLNLTCAKFTAFWYVVPVFHARATATRCG